MMKKYVLPSIFVIVMLLAGAWLGRLQIMKVIYKKQWQDSSPEAHLKEHEKTILADRTVLEKYDIFKPSKGTKDAGPYLNSRIHWKIDEVDHRGDLVLPDSVKKEFEKDWINKKPDFKKLGLKFDWMKELQQFDHWSPEENSPAYPKGKKYNPYSYPIPTYKDLMIWAKLRLLYGREMGELASALLEVRHLTRLIFTNDYYVSTMVAIRMLKFENEIHEGKGEVIPEDVVVRAKRYFRSLPGLVDLRLTDATFTIMTNTRVGLCSMIVEGLTGYVSQRDLLQDELKDSFKRMDGLVKNSQQDCRQTIVHQMWNDPTWPGIMDDEMDAFANVGESALVGKKMTWRELKKQDDLKVLIGYVLGAVGGVPGYLGGYEK